MKPLSRPIESYFSFTFIRNPWDRMVSNWAMFNRPGLRRRQLKSMTDKDLSNFDDFALFASQMNNHHWVPQSLYVPDKIDFIGRLETFDRDYEHVLQKINSPLMKPPVKNATKREKDYRQYYTPASFELVSKMYAEDIQRFDYAFDDAGKL